MWAGDPNILDETRALRMQVSLVVPLLIFIDYVYANLRQKSSDAQFISKNIQIPPAIPLPWTETAAYPTILLRSLTETKRSLN